MIVVFNILIVPDIWPDGNDERLTLIYALILLFVIHRSFCSSKIGLFWYYRMKRYNNKTQPKNSNLTAIWLKESLIKRSITYINFHVMKVVRYSICVMGWSQMKNYIIFTPTIVGRSVLLHFLSLSTYLNRIFTSVNSTNHWHTSLINS